MAKKADKKRRRQVERAIAVLKKAGVSVVLNCSVRTSGPVYFESTGHPLYIVGNSFVEFDGNAKIRG